MPTVPKIPHYILFIALFYSLFCLTTGLIDYINAQRSPQAILKTLKILQPCCHGAPCSAAPHPLFDGQLIKKTILGLIDKAQKDDTLSITTFIMTDSEIAQALIKKHRQAVSIRVIADSSHAEKEYSKVNDLIKAGICVYLHNPSSPDIMHNKFLIFDYKDTDPVVITGSYNLTNSAANKNSENMVIIAHPETVNAYITHFSKLEKNSIRAHAPDVKKSIQKIGREKIDMLLAAHLRER